MQNKRAITPFKVIQGHRGGRDLSYGIKIWTNLSSVLSQCTRLTDGQTAFSSLDRIACSAVKTTTMLLILSVVMRAHTIIRSSHITPLREFTQLL